MNNAHLTLTILCCIVIVEVVSVLHNYLFKQPSIRKFLFEGYVYIKFMYVFSVSLVMYQAASKFPHTFIMDIWGRLSSFNLLKLQLAKCHCWQVVNTSVTVRACTLCPDCLRALNMKAFISGSAGTIFIKAAKPDKWKGAALRPCCCHVARKQGECCFS